MPSAIMIINPILAPIVLHCVTNWKPLVTAWMKWMEDLNDSFAAVQIECSWRRR